MQLDDGHAVQSIIKLNKLVGRIILEISDYPGIEFCIHEMSNEEYELFKRHIAETIKRELL